FHSNRRMQFVRSRIAAVTRELPWNAHSMLAIGIGRAVQRVKDVDAGWSLNGEELGDDDRDACQDVGRGRRQPEGVVIPGAGSIACATAWQAVFLATVDP